MSNKTDRIIRIPEVAEYFGVSEMTIRRLVQRGELEHLRIGRAICFTEQNISDFIESHRNVAEMPTGQGG